MFCGFQGDAFQNDAFQICKKVSLGPDWFRDHSRYHRLKEEEKRRRKKERRKLLEERARKALEAEQDFVEEEVKVLSDQIAPESLRIPKLKKLKLIKPAKEDNQDEILFAFNLMAQDPNREEDIAIMMMMLELD